MSKENTRNVIILKNLPSNLIAEAILVVKDKKQEKKLRKAVGEARQMCYNILQIYYLQ